MSKKYEGKFKTEQQKKSSMQKRVFPVVLGVVLGLVVTALLGGYGYYRSKIALLQYSDGTRSTEGTISRDEAEVLEENQSMQDLTAGLEQMDAVLSGAEVESHEEIFNILLIGTDERTKAFSEEARGDSIMLCSLNLTTGEIKLVSFGRGIGVPILEGRFQGQWDWLTHSFRYGGADLMMKEITECFKVDVQHYARVNIRTFMEAVNVIGGVDIELTEAEANYINYPSGTYAEYHIGEMGVWQEVQTVTPGLNHLNGATAMLYARCRYIDDDWQRVERQRNVIQAALRQVKSLGLGQLDALIDTIFPLIQTNLTESEITNLLLHAPAFLQMNLEQMTLPAEGTYGSMVGMDERTLYAVDFDKNAQILQEFLYGIQEEAATTQPGTPG